VSKVAAPKVVGTISADPSKFTPPIDLGVVRVAADPVVFRSSVPVVMLVAFRAVSPEPFPDMVPFTSRVVAGLAVPTPTLVVVVSTKRFAVPTSMFEAALYAFVGLLKFTVDAVFELITISIWSRLNADAYTFPLVTLRWASFTSKNVSFPFISTIWGGFFKC
jgi:hypothetical protein